MAIAVSTANLGTNFSAGGLSIDVTTTAAVPSDGFIVIGVEWFGDSISNAITGASGGGLGWNIDKNSEAGDVGSMRFGILSAQAPSGLAISTTITVSFTGAFTGIEQMIGATSLTGVKTTSPLDGTPPLVTGTAGISVWTTPSMAIQDGSILFGIAASDNSGNSNTPTAPSIEAWERDQIADSFSTVMEYRIEPTGGSFTNDGTFGGTGFVTVGAVAYLAATGGPPPAADTTTRRYQIRRSRMTSW